ncbi:MAG: MarR family transcriptional regulator [Alphaproteobacteria bacterium]|nr:MarR family transcriptional regulator [Alphaproteobacteria bacterium]
MGQINRVTPPPSVSASAVAELLEQVVRIAHGRAFAHGLNPAQWTALRYCAQANESSRTVSAFARYHATSRGTASQTISALVRKGYLTRVPGPGRGASHRLSVTLEGTRLLVSDPVNQLITGIQALPEEKGYLLAETLEGLLGHMFAYPQLLDDTAPLVTDDVTMEARQSDVGRFPVVHRE